MRVLVTGGAGFLGSHVAQALRERGHEPCALVRPNRSEPGLDRLGIATVEGDLCDEDSLRRALRGAEGLVHCAVARSSSARTLDEQRAVNVEGLSALLRAAHDLRVARIVHVSTLGTLGSTRERRALDEGCRMDARTPRLSFLGTKREAEERALAAAWAGLGVVVVNPGLLLGPRLDGREPTGILAQLAARRIRWVPPGGVGCCDVADVAAAIVAALERGRAGERHALGGHPLSWRELCAAAAASAGVPPPTLELPRFALPVLAAASGWRGRHGRERTTWAPDVLPAPGGFVHADSAKSVRELGYSIRPLADTLRRASAAPLDVAPRAAGVSPP